MPALALAADWQAKEDQAIEAEGKAKQLQQELHALEKQHADEIESLSKEGEGLLADWEDGQAQLAQDEAHLNALVAEVSEIEKKGEEELAQLEAAVVKCREQLAQAQREREEATHRVVEGV